MSETQEIEALVRELQALRTEMGEIRRKVDENKEGSHMEADSAEQENEEDEELMGEGVAVMWDHVLHPTAIAASDPASADSCNLLGAPPPSSG